MNGASPSVFRRPAAALLRNMAALLIAAGVPAAAFAFIDERTPPPAPTIIPPAPAPVPAPPAPLAAAPAAFVPDTPRSPFPVVQAPSTSTSTSAVAVAVAVAVATPAAATSPAIPVPAAPTPVSITLEPNVRGDLGRPGWSKPYPGPYGQLLLSEALIANIVPVVGGAIQLNGDPVVLNRQVTLNKGAANRLDALKAMAQTEGLSILVQGEMVSVASARQAASASGGGVATLSLGSSGITEQAAPLKTTKTWKLAAGAMLSTAMLEWAQQWDWKLIWKADVDYRIAAPITITDDFLGGVGQVLDAYKGGDRPLWGDWNDAQKVLVIREPSNREQ